MTIDEAISHAREVAEIHRNNDKLNKTLGKRSPYYNTDCIKCAKEHEQLAEWLKELKDYRDKNKMVVRVDVENMDSVKDKIDELSKYAESQYNRAIDDFVNACKEDILCQTFGLHANGIERIAEQLKAGGKNGTDNQ